MRAPALLALAGACTTSRTLPTFTVAPFSIEPSYLDVGDSVEEHSAGGFAMRISPGAPLATEAHWERHVTRQVLAAEAHVPTLMRVTWHAFRYGEPGRERDVATAGRELLVDCSGPDLQATTPSGEPVALPQLIAVRDERWPSTDAELTSLAYQRMWTSGAWLEVPARELTIATIVAGGPTQLAVEARIRLVELQGNEAVFEVEFDGERRQPRDAVTVSASVQFRLHRLSGVPLWIHTRVDERLERPGLLIATTLEQRTTWTYHLATSQGTTPAPEAP